MSMFLFDENISHRIIKIIQADYPESEHVNNLKLINRHDITIWQYAKANLYRIVNYDEDFNALSLIKGYPPKIIWIRSANLTTKQLVNLMIDRKHSIHNFLTDDSTGCLELYV